MECNYNKDVIKGAETNEIKVKLIEIMEEKFVDDE